MISSWNRIDTVTMKVGKSTFEEINGGFRKRLCYVTTAVCRSLQKPDECYELKLLREYRDRYLVSSEGGKETIREYYNIAPTIVKTDRTNGRSRRYLPKDLGRVSESMHPSDRGRRACGV